MDRGTPSGVRIAGVDHSVIDKYFLEREISTRLPENVYRPYNVVVIGCGGIGSWVALSLALLTSSAIYLVDDDVLEESNFGRIPLPPHFSGTPKAVALASYIKVLRPDIEVVPFVQRITSSDELFTIVHTLNLKEYTVIVETTDSPLAQRVVNEGIVSLYDYIHSIRVRTGLLYVQAHYDGWRYSVFAYPYPYKPTLFIRDDAGAGYSITPSIVAVPVFVAGIVTGLVLSKPSRPFFMRGDMRELYASSTGKR
jgi:hypothetical protein